MAKAKISEEEAAEMKEISMAAIENFSASAALARGKTAKTQTKPARQLAAQQASAAASHGVAWRA
jgi:hypothetical protein